MGTKGPAQKILVLTLACILAWSGLPAPALAQMLETNEEAPLVETDDVTSDDVAEMSATEEDDVVSLDELEVEPIVLGDQTAEEEAIVDVVADEEPTDDAIEVTDPVAAEPAAMDETAAGDSVATDDRPLQAAAAAKGIGLNTDVTGSITEIAQHDYYRFTLPTSGRVVISGTYNYGGASCNLYGIDDNTNIAFFVAAKKNYKFSQTIDLIKGSYRLDVYQFGSDLFSKGSYSFKVAFTSAKETFVESVADGMNNSFGNADVIQLNKAYRGQIAYNDFTDIYRFDLAKASTITIAGNFRFKQAGVFIYDAETSWLCSWPYYDDTYDATTGKLTFSKKIKLSAGTYYLDISHCDGTGNTGPYAIKVSPVTKNLSSAKVSSIADQKYTGKEICPSPVVKYGSTTLSEGKDYNLSYKNNVKVGTATVVITGKGNYTGTITTTFKIVKKKKPNVSKAKVADISDKIYSGKAFEPKPKVTYNGKQLYDGTDFVYKYANNVKPGLAKVTIVGIGAYTGTQTVEFLIKKRPISKAKVSTISRRAYTGSKIKPSPTVKWNGTTLKKDKDYTLSYKNNRAAGKATVIISGKGNYGGTKKVTFRIVRPHVYYRVIVKDSKWQETKHDGQTSGTTGKGLRIKGLQIALGTNFPVSGGIKYRVHLRSSGWQDWRKNGDAAGNSKAAKQPEAIQIKLTGNMAKKYDVWYRVHAQKFGWMGWTKNGDSAGTTGYGYRMEAVQVKLVLKGGDAPGSTKTSYSYKDSPASAVSEDEPNNARTSANRIGIGTIAKGKTDYDDDDFFVVNIPSNGYYYVSLASGSVAGTQYESWLRAQMNETSFDVSANATGGKSHKTYFKKGKSYIWVYGSKNLYQHPYYLKVSKV